MVLKAFHPFSPIIEKTASFYAPYKGSMYFDFTLNPTFKISKEQISQISGGVKKIRLVTTTGYIDKELKKYKIGAAIKAQYELIQDKFKETTSITDGF